MNAVTQFRAVSFHCSTHEACKHDGGSFIPLYFMYLANKNIFSHIDGINEENGKMELELSIYMYVKQGV